MTTIIEKDTYEYQINIICSSIHTWIIKYISGTDKKNTIHWRKVLNELINVRDKKDDAWTLKKTSEILNFNKWNTKHYGRNRLPLTYDRFCRIFDLTKQFVDGVVEGVFLKSGSSFKFNEVLADHPFHKIISSMVVLYPIYMNSDDTNINIGFSLLQESIDIEIHKYLNENFDFKELDDKLGYNILRETIIDQEQELKKKTDEEKKKAFEIKKKLKKGVCVIDMSNVEIEKPT
jgi:hypothetical protein